MSRSLSPLLLFELNGDGKVFEPSGPDSEARGLKKTQRILSIDDRPAACLGTDDNPSMSGELLPSPESVRFPRLLTKTKSECRCKKGPRKVHLPLRDAGCAIVNPIASLRRLPRAVSFVYSEIRLSSSPGTTNRD